MCVEYICRCRERWRSCAGWRRKSEGKEGGYVLKVALGRLESPPVWVFNYASVS
ncbi:hypothetical protein C2E23DRAFT_827390 [Lenzites betulinus]|nr:hypothetical protein C2E23DRAFT_848214 [Lenzites betulinus]KAH9848482.1 hypothetical protein C2E23DRAFT_844188 [Lenzites betulinus]KAH9852069.1 hypothetical protein C2E23DRAFT_827390 [Lenzites betulinus]